MADSGFRLADLAVARAARARTVKSRHARAEEQVEAPEVVGRRDQRRDQDHPEPDLPDHDELAQLLVAEDQRQNGDDLARPS